MYSLKKIINPILKKWFYVKNTRVNKTIEKLFFGFSEQAAIDLENFIYHSKSKPKDKSEAALAMARWNLIHGNLQKSYDLLITARKFYPQIAKTENYCIREINCLIELNKHEEARIKVNNSLENHPNSTQLKILKSNTFQSSISQDNDKLDCINQFYHDHDLVTIKKSNPELPLQLDNLTTTLTHCSVPRNQQAKLSIIIPAYSAAKTLHIAVNSLRNQTWENIEIIIVDDCSPDETFSVAKRLAEQDSRIKVYQTSKNGGSYAARNLAIQHATGEFITVNDADDWSHPQKLEKQICRLIDNPMFSANCSFWIRCSFQLEFYNAGQININHSSWMLRRSTLIELEGWDEVRIGADSELIRRLNGRYGEKSIYKLLENAPLSLGLRSSESLTQNSSTHVRTLAHGVRRIYRETSQYYHDFHASSNHWKIKNPNRQRAFPAPRNILPDRPEATKYDLVWIMDYCLRGGSYVSTINYIKAALGSGLRVAIFHWRRYDLDPKSIMNREIRQMVHEGAVDLICPGEEVFTNTAIAGYPVMLQYVIDLAPKIHCERFAIVTNQMPARFYDGRDVQYDPRIVSANVMRLFGIQPVWIPISNLVRFLMQRDERFESIHHETWTPLIDVKVWCQSKVTWRGKDRMRPKVGRHSRDHYTKWPTTKKAIKDAYCASRNCEVELLGGADTLKKRFHLIPKNWTIYPFGSVDSKIFLKDLDFFIHYPNEGYIEEFGRAIIEAMAIGVPVILPPVFEQTFGQSALYCDADQVWTTIESLWQDPAAWEQRSQAGQNYVIKNFDWDQFVTRLDRLMNY